MVEAIAIVGTIVSACGLINDIRKAFKPVSVKKEAETLFDFVEATKRVMNHLDKRLRKERCRDTNKELINELNKLKDNLVLTIEFLQKIKDNPPPAIRILKVKRLKKDIESKHSVLEKSRSDVMDHVSIDCLPSGDQANGLSRDYLISANDLSDFEDMCDGTWGPVKKARFKGYQDVVIKYVSDVRNRDLIENFEKEARILVKFWFGYVVRLIGICDQQDVKFLVLEYMQKESLDYLLHNRPEEVLEPKRRVAMALDTAKAVLQVQDARSLHTGIESKRFLVDKDFNVKISDLRFAKTLSSCKRYRSSRSLPVNSQYYLCPERYSPAPYTEESEVYSLGIVLWEILSRSKPFSTLENELGREPSFNEVKTFVTAKRREQLSQDFGNPRWNSALNDLVQQCRNVIPEERPVGGVRDVVKQLDEILDDMEREGEGN